MHEKLAIRNFTVFSDFEVEFSPGINVFIGANGTGKTHLLKLLYAAQAAQANPSDGVGSIDDKLVRVFRPDMDKLGRLVTRRQGHNNAKIIAHWKGWSVRESSEGGKKLLTRQSKNVTIRFGTRSTKAEITGNWGKVTKPVYIPVKEMLSIAPGFRSMYEKYDLKFEEIYYDILSLAYLPALRGKPSPERRDLAESIHNVISGSVVEVGEKFFLRTKTLGTGAKGSGNLEITLAAEGMRKLALIWKLIQNGALPDGLTLFWDEPEANLNPKMMQFVAEILLKLHGMGIQIFVATHSYALLRELSFQKKNESKVRFFSLFFTEDGLAVDKSVADDYEGINPNLIAEEYSRLYDLQIDQAFGK